MLHSTLGLPILDEVRKQYELHPFPHYSLFLPIRQQEAYASTALFATQLLREQGITPALDLYPEARILIAGCGDMFPSLLARWEPRSHRVDAIDLSTRNISRARLRVALSLRRMNFSQGALEETPWLSQARYSHVDAYGVLHHTANPSSLLARIAQGMLPGASLRLMVYNSPAREWIQHLQHSFQLLGIDRHRREDLRLTRRFLELFIAEIPSLRTKLQPLRSSVLAHDTRLVDTFLHAREARLSFAFWWDAIEAAGLRAIGLFDRYAELDDLTSPLFNPPKLSELEERAADGRFENNLELFCVKAPSPATASHVRKPLALPWNLYRCGPPTFWGLFEETARLGLPLKMSLWRAFLRTLAGRQDPALDFRLKDIPLASIQRLSRIGALWPAQISDPDLRQSLLNRMHEAMEVPTREASRELEKIPELLRLLDRTLQEKGRSSRHRSLILKRWQAAQDA